MIEIPSPEHTNPDGSLLTDYGALNKSTYNLKSESAIGRRNFEK